MSVMESNYRDGSYDKRLAVEDQSVFLLRLCFLPNVGYQEFIDRLDEIKRRGTSEDSGVEPQ